MERVIIYIDGFNLYFGLKSKGWQRYYWLNLQKLAQNLLTENQHLITTKYFTSRISKPPEKSRRQATYIEVLETLDNFQIFYGHYLINTIECNKCGNIIPKPNEKMTDVNIAVEMLTDAFQNKFDKALIVASQLILPNFSQKILPKYRKEKRPYSSYLVQPFWVQLCQFIMAQDFFHCWYIHDVFAL